MIDNKMKDQAFKDARKENKTTDFKPILDNRVNEVEKTMKDGRETVEYRWMVVYYDSLTQTRRLIQMPEDPIDPFDFDRVQVYFKVKPQDQPGLMDSVTVDRFLNGESPTFTDCFYSLLASEKKWMVYQNEQDYWFNALVKLSTFFYDIFNSLGYVRLQGFKASGKSRYLNLLVNLSYHGVLVTQSTVASMFRLIQANMPTLAIDEFEQPDIDILGVINQGYKRGAKVPRCDENDGFSVKFFDVYGPKALASINELDATTQSRCFTQIMLKSVDTEQVQREEVFTDEQSLQQDLYILRLTKLADVEKSVKEIRESQDRRNALKGEFDKLFEDASNEGSNGQNAKMEHVSGRLWEMTSPLFILSGLIEEDDIRETLQRNLARYVLEEMRFRETETVQDIETTILSYLVKTDQANRYVFLSEIKNTLAEEYNIEDLNEKSISSTLKKLGFKDRRRGGSSGLTKAFIPEGPLFEACRTYNVAVPDDKNDKLEDFKTTEETEANEETEGKLDPLGVRGITGIAEQETIDTFKTILRQTVDCSKAQQDEQLEKTVGPNHPVIAKRLSSEGTILRKNEDSPWKVA
jgi:hypothetical protein